MNKIKIASFLIVIMLPTLANAAYYQYLYGGLGVPADGYPSSGYDPQQVCDSTAYYFRSSSSGELVIPDGILSGTQPNFTCTSTRPSGSIADERMLTATTCTNPEHWFNSDLGVSISACQTPPEPYDCSENDGQTFTREYPIDLSSSPTGEYNDITNDSCRAIAISIDECYSYPDDQPNGYCVATYEYTGASAIEGIPDTLPSTPYSGDTQITPNPPTSSEEITAPVVTTDEGTTTVETTTETTTVENVGPNITNEETVTIEYSDGTTTETIITTTVVTTPEGVTTTTTEQTITETISDTNVIEFTGGGSTGSTIPGGTTTGTTTTTSTVGSDGSSTSDSTCTGIGCTGGSSTGSEEGIEDAEYDGPKAGDPESWWESKYPDGINTVFTDFQATHITGGPLGTWLNSWTLASSGTCPTWSVSTAGLPVNLGNIDLSIDCDIYTFIRAILLVTASFVAFRLIFGR